jgi:hypothetical protein
MELYSEIHKNSYEEAGIVMTKEGFKVLK